MASVSSTALTKIRLGKKTLKDRVDIDATYTSVAYVLQRGPKNTQTKNDAEKRTLRLTLPVHDTQHHERHNIIVNVLHPRDAMQCDDSSSIPAMLCSTDTVQCNTTLDQCRIVNWALWFIPSISWNDNLNWINEYVFMEDPCVAGFFVWIVIHNTAYSQVWERRHMYTATHS